MSNADYRGFQARTRPAKVNELPQIGHVEPLYPSQAQSEEPKADDELVPEADLRSVLADRHEPAVRRLIREPPSRVSSLHLAVGAAVVT